MNIKKNTIPKHIMQYWDTDEIPKDIQLLMNSWKKMNPEYDYTLFNRKMAIDFLDKNYSKKIVELFKSAKLPAMQSDIFRVAYIIKRGGIYVDAATECVKDITELINIGSELILMRKWNSHIWNGFIASKPDNRILKIFFNKIIKNLEVKKLKNIWLATGPGLLTDIIDFLYEKDDLEITILSQVKDCKNYFNLVNKLEHKKDGTHWSTVQKIVNIYEYKEDTISMHEILKNKKIIVHMGQHKTGSTALQRLMVSSTAHKEKYIYPKTGLKFSAHNEMVRIFSRNNAESIKNLMQSFFEEVSKSKANIVVLSNDFFSSSNELMFNENQILKLWKNLQNLLEPFGEKEIVFYVREQADVIESRINQAIKSRICLTHVDVKKILQNPSLDYSLFTKLLQKNFPSAIIRPRIYEPSSFENGDICTDFTSTFIGKSMSCKQSNPRIQFIDQVLLFMRINKLNVDVDEKMALKNKFKNYQGNKDIGSILTNEEVLYIRNKYMESNKEFFKKYPDIGKFKYDFSSTEKYSVADRMLTIENFNLIKNNKK